MTRQEFLYEVKDYVYITLGLLLYTFSFTLFLLPYQIVTGGISGIGAIVFYSTGFPVQYTFFIINAVLIVMALKILGWKFLTKTIYATFMLTLFLEIFQDIITMPNGEFYKILGENNDFMSLLIGCMMTGTALAIVFLNNGSTGGTDIVAAVLNKFHNITLGKALIMIDICIIGSCLFVDSFGAIDLRCRKVVFGLCTMVIECLMLDYVMFWQRQSVQFLIFSKKYQEIAYEITRITDHTLTILDGHGYYSGKPTKVICLLAKKRESLLIFRIVKSIDPNAFVSQSAVIGVYGEGFDAIKVNVKKKSKT
ncbi:MAG: YitT family protein [Bacteroidales bacterium]|nr:YitT family protein [Bacteroidales bacterium]